MCIRDRSVGGPKFPGLYADKEASEIRDIFTSKLIRDEGQSKLVEEKLKKISAKNKERTGREIFEASKSAIKNPEILDQAQKAINGKIACIRRLFCYSKEDSRKSSKTFPKAVKYIETFFITSKSCLLIIISLPNCL